MLSLRKLQKSKTKERDREILRQLRQGKNVKAIVLQMGLSSNWVVYHAVKKHNGMRKIKGKVK